MRFIFYFLIGIVLSDVGSKLGFNLWQTLLLVVGITLILTTIETVFLGK